MSCKVYVAFKLKRSRDLWPLVRDVKRIGQRNIKKELVKLYAEFRANVDTDSDAYKDLIEKYKYSEWSARHSIASRAIREGYRLQLGRYERNTFNFDVNIGIWENAGSMYLIPFADMLMRDTLKFLRRDKRLTNFAYWNNTDQPKNVSQKEWDARGKVWDAIDAAGWDNHLVIDVCSWSGWHIVDPWLDEAKKHAKETKTPEIFTHQLGVK